MIEEEIMFTYIGIPDCPENLRSEWNFTCVELSWDHPSEYHGTITQFEVSYHCAAGNLVLAHATDNVNTSTSLLLTGLKQNTKCSIGVRAHTSAGPGKYSNISVTTNQLGQFCSRLYMMMQAYSNVRLARP